ncbi:MAG: hypothetical protein P1U87_17750 [Verrucomicrobiales bacterium]|nr:hypothetical protein [Verrucomicrobiales bacterium]
MNQFSTHSFSRGSRSRITSARDTPLNRPAFAALCGLLFLFVSGFAQAQAERPGKKPGIEKKKNGKKKGPDSRKGLPQLTVVNPFAELNDSRVHEDFPVMCLNDEGKAIVVYIEHNGQSDSLKLAGRDQAGQLKSMATVSNPGVENVYQPCLTKLPNGRILCVWSQLQKDGQWDLVGRVIGRKGLAVAGKSFSLTENPGNDIFADLGTDRNGRVWLVWQRMNGGINQIVAKHLDSGSEKWSEEIFVTTGEGGGDWEPRLAFGNGEDALVAFDSYRRGDFDVYLTKVSPDGSVLDPISIASSDRYEARPELATSPDGKTLWIAYEDGMKLWGKDLGAEWRKKGGGLHHDRQLKVVKVDLESLAVEKVADITALLPDLVADPQSVGTGAIDVPEVVVDADGCPWLFFRFCLFNSPGFWQIAYSRFDPASEEWKKPEVLGNSAYCLDRRTSVALDPADGSLKVIYPSDLRKNKQARNCGIYLASIATGEDRPSTGRMPFDLLQEAPTLLEPYNETPERDREDHHRWEFEGEGYQLVWGDVHRHTDFSNCRTTDDGCIVEHYRYAIEAGGLDFLGTSDHTEIGKTLTDYEWWQTQKLADLFHNPGSFVSLYAYEREQKYPYGHRNVLFLKRGGPVVYIKRKNYAESRWATPLPEPDGDIFGDIPPWQLWDLLRVHGKRAITIEHTSAGGMGTDWSKYSKLDSEFENILEVFQGSRNSSEGEGAPQPPVVVGSPQESRFTGNSAKGTWQVALGLNHRLGAFASSDHRSTNVSYGGVYVKEFTREALFDAMDVRRTVAATDKIYMEFSCNDHMMGGIFETEEPVTLTMAVAGTAPLSRITLVRNEEDYQVYTPDVSSSDFSATFTDKAPTSGENRYYLRVEQSDGNMGWTSPVWVTVP